jgi:hypothetical protein
LPSSASSPSTRRALLEMHGYYGVVVTVVAFLL